MGLGLPVEILQVSEELLSGVEVGVAARGQVGVSFTLGRLVPVVPEPRDLRRHRDIGDENQFAVAEDDLDLRTRLVQAERAAGLYGDGHRAVALLHGDKTKVLLHGHRIFGIPEL